MLKTARCKCYMWIIAVVHNQAGSRSRFERAGEWKIVRRTSNLGNPICRQLLRWPSGCSGMWYCSSFKQVIVLLTQFCSIVVSTTFRTTSVHLAPARSVRGRCSWMQCWPNIKLASYLDVETRSEFVEHDLHGFCLFWWRDVKALE